MRREVVSVTVIAALGCSACSSRPRSFEPVSAVAVTGDEGFRTAWLGCRAEVAARTNQKSGRLASAATGVAAGAGASVAVGAATAGTYATYGGAFAALGATIIAAPIALVGGAWGMSKIRKTRKEKAIKAATAECMKAAGYPVERWEVLSKREARAIDAGVTPPPPPR